MIYILDATVFFSEVPITGSLYTTPSVIAELLDLHAKCRYEKLSAEGLQVIPPSEESGERVRVAARSTRDSPAISGTDCDLLALALDLGAAVCTDDFAVQNVAAELGIAIWPLLQRPAKKIVWKYRCTGCGRYFETGGECPVCGSNIRRKLK
jgi:UPF0271 protein